MPPIAPIDQLGREIRLSSSPRRIISLVPSQTELLHYLGLEEEIAGITKFCIHPSEWFHTKTRIGGTKRLNFEKIAALRPDLIIGNKEENEEKQIKELMRQYPVWMSDIRRLDDALDMIGKIGELLNRKSQAIELKNEIEQKFSHFTPARQGIQASPVKVAYFVWREPYMLAGGDTFINDMLGRCRWQNAALLLPSFQKGRERYPRISAEELKELNPDLILLSSEPFPFKEKHLPEFQSICPHSKILLVDGEMFSWYGSRLLYATVYFQQLFQHP